MNAELGLAVQAWLLGLAVTALVVLPGTVVLDGILSDPFLKTLPARFLAYFAMLLPNLLMTATFGVLLSAPLFLAGLLAAYAFRQQIARHPLPFAALAPCLRWRCLPSCLPRCETRTLPRPSRSLRMLGA